MMVKPRGSAWLRINQVRNGKVWLYNLHITPSVQVWHSTDDGGSDEGPGFCHPPLRRAGQEGPQGGAWIRHTREAHGDCILDNQQQYFPQNYYRFDNDDWRLWAITLTNTNWKGLWKLAPSDNFVAIFQVVQSPLKFAMPTLFMWKNVRVFFHKRGNKDRERGSFVQFCPYFSAFLEKQTFSNTKRINMANFSRFRATWKITTKLSLGAGLHGAIQLVKPEQY